MHFPNTESLASLIPPGDSHFSALAVAPELSRWNGQSPSSGQRTRVYGFTDLDGGEPDAGAMSSRCRTPADRRT